MPETASNIMHTFFWRWNLELLWKAVLLQRTSIERDPCAVLWEKIVENIVRMEWNFSKMQMKCTHIPTFYGAVWCIFKENSTSIFHIIPVHPPTWGALTAYTDNDSLILGIFSAKRLTSLAAIQLWWVYRVFEI